MSNVRPWFRLSSIARPTAQGSSDPPPPLPRTTPRRPVTRPPPKQPSPPRQRQPPSPPRQQRQPPSPPRQQRQPPSPPRQQTPPPPLPQERSPYHSPPSRYIPPKAASPPPPQSRLSYTPPSSPKEVQEALPPRKPISPPSPTHSNGSVKSESSESTRKASSPRVLSPYSLPPPQLHSERETTQKNILTAEKTSQFHEPNHHNHNQNHNHQGNNPKKIHRQPSSSDSESILNTRVITIAGENKGAVMEILRSPSSNKTGGVGTHSSRVLNNAGEKGRRLQSSSSSSSDEGKGKKKTTKNPNNGNSNLPMKAFMNSNVQMINNSLVYNSTATHHDPGVHLKISRKPGSDNGFYVQDYGNGGYTN